MLRRSPYAGSLSVLFAKNEIDSQKNFVRPFYMWLNFVFNRKDEARVKEIGPDRAAAEWILRNGGSVKFSSSQSWLKNYASIPLGPGKVCELIAIDAANASITDNGFAHLDGLTCLQRLDLNGCKYISDISQLKSVKDSLVYLNLGNCRRLGDMTPLAKLIKLKELVLTDTLGKGREQQIEGLANSLPDCRITT